jgi:cell division protein FtsQ
LQQIATKFVRTTKAATAGRRSTSKARRRQTRSVISLRSLALGSILVACAVAAGITLERPTEPTMESLAAGGERTRLEQILAIAGFGLDEVVVTGHRFTSDSDIFDRLDLDAVRTMVAFDGAATRARLLELPWIATASITRAYPGRITVAVTERTPYAVWVDGERSILVDATGRHLSPIRPTDMPHLMRMTGEGAPQAARALFDTLAYFPEIASRLQTAVRITGRRWSLQLTRGLTLELPSEGEATALAELLADPAARQLLDRENTAIDLRAKNRLALRLAQEG